MIKLYIQLFGGRGAFSSNYNKKMKLNIQRFAKKISSKEYNRLAHIVNTYPKKFSIGLNTIRLDDYNIIINYFGYDDFKIVKKRKVKKNER